MWLRSWGRRSGLEEKGFCVATTALGRVRASAQDIAVREREFAVEAARKRHDCIRRALSARFAANTAITMAMAMQGWEYPPSVRSLCTRSITKRAHEGQAP